MNTAPVMKLFATHVAVNASRPKRTEARAGTTLHTMLKSRNRTDPARCVTSRRTAGRRWQSNLRLQATPTEAMTKHGHDEGAEESVE